MVENGRGNDLPPLPRISGVETPEALKLPERHPRESFWDRNRAQPADDLGKGGHHDAIGPAGYSLGDLLPGRVSKKVGAVDGHVLRRGASYVRQGEEGDVSREGNRRTGGHARALQVTST